jgi:AAA+ superfamily predicted ATPase
MTLGEMFDDMAVDFDWKLASDAMGGVDGASLLPYARNVLGAVEPASDEAQVLVGWLSRNRQRLGLEDGLFNESDAERGERRSKTRPIGKARWAAFRHALDRRALNGRALDGRSGSGAPVLAHSLNAGFEAVTTALGLQGLDAALFRLVVLYRLDNRFERLFDGLALARGRATLLRRYPDLFALLIGDAPATINARFRADAPLVASGAIRLDDDGDIQIASRLVSLIHACSLGETDVRTELLGAPVAAKLPWAAFRHLGAEIEIARKVLRQTVASGTERGVHVLLYGPPGTGKTECAASLAAELGLTLHVIGERSESGREPSRGERLSDLLLAQQIGVVGEGLYLFDEAEDLFRPRTSDREPDPKIFVHRLLETAKVPMIWAANDLGAFSSAVLRRMSLCIEVRLPPQDRRAELWQELAVAEGVALDAPTARKLARLIPSAPSVARTALRATRLAGGDAETAELVASGMARAIGHGSAAAPEAEVETLYDPALSAADGDLVAIAERLARPGASRTISLLLSGPPGTGKSAFARHLAGRMGMTVLQKRGSDLFGPFVGQTEAQIAAAFAEARATNAFLIFDEADSLLMDRSGAHRSWEVSQVNEMLTWMESHPLPFVCTTNLPDRLDKASLRRFLVRVNFAPMRAEQAAVLFRRVFGREPPAGLARLDRLTPADFTRVARRIAVLGLDDDADAVLALFAAELEGREGMARPIGFGIGFGPDR